MTVELIFSLIGGLGFFFFGMKTMSEGLKKIAGKRLKSILHIATKIPIIGLLIGALVTCLLQSSSATTVMVVGFVNAGLLGLRQAISIIMGANIGTTFTAWLVSSMSVFKITTYALPLVGIGFALNTFGRTKNSKFWGQVIMGFGILFIGLGFMKDAFAPLKESQHLKDIFTTLSFNPLLGILAGIIFTVLLQSSSATIAIVQVLAFSGVISFPAAIPLIIGDNIGTTITAQLASIGTNVASRRTAVSHTLFNVFGALYMLFFIYNGWFVKFIEFIIPGGITLKNIMFYIAVSHSLFNVFNSLIFLPFIGILEKICIRLVPQKKDAVDIGPQYLERHLLATPSIALEQATKEIVRMLGLSKHAVDEAMRAFFDKDYKLLGKVREKEDAIDNLQVEITNYVVQISQGNLTPEESERLPVLLHSVNDVERIGDHAENIAELAERAIEEKLPFSDMAVNDLRTMYAEVEVMMDDVEEAFLSQDMERAKKALEREEKINKMQLELRAGHIARLNERKCKPLSGVIFLDCVNNLEKIGDHLTNIAQAVNGALRLDKISKV